MGNHLTRLIGAISTMAAFHLCSDAQNPAETPKEAVYEAVPKGIVSQKPKDGEVYVAYAEHFPGNDWGEKINNAMKAVRGGTDGGEVVLPPGTLTISTTIDLRGPKEDFPKGGAQSIVLRGSGGAQGSHLIWSGAPKQAIIDMSGAWHCQLKNLWIDGDKIPGVIGIRYGGGEDREVNGGKVSALDDIHIWRCDVGLEIGSIFGPDLVAGCFRNLWIWQVRIGVRVMGSNVAMMQFYNVSLSFYDEAGFKLIGHSGRLIRSRTEAQTSTTENVLRDPDGNEVFLEGLSPWILQHRVVREKHPHVAGSDKRPWVGGGYPEIVIYGLSAHSHRKDVWLIDTDWSPVRIYSARIEGQGGVMRFGSNFGGIRNNVVFVDLSATSKGAGSNGNVIEMHGKGPLYLLACAFNGNVALGNTQVFSDGVYFMKEKAGFVTLPGYHGPAIHEPQSVYQTTVPVNSGDNSLDVLLANPYRQPDEKYQVSVTANWNAGAIWVTDKRTDQFTVRFEKSASDGKGEVDVVIRRTPFRSSETEY